MVAQRRAKLRREDEAIVGLKPVERIRAEPVGDEHQGACRFVEDGGTERALQQSTNPLLVGPIEPREDRGGAIRRLLTGLGESRLQLVFVVEFPVEKYLQRTVGLELRPRLKNAQVDSTKRPALLRTDQRFAPKAATTIHRREHCVKSAVEILPVGSAHNSQQSRHCLADHYRKGWASQSYPNLAESIGNR